MINLSQVFAIRGVVYRLDLYQGINNPSRHRYPWPSQGSISSGSRSLCYPHSLKENMTGGDVVSKATCLTEKYPNAYSDFYGSGTPCVYKSGPGWPIRKGPLAQGIVREHRPVHGRAIQPIWVSIGMRICDELESIGIMWTSVNPLAYANAGEPKPFCPASV